MRGRLACAAVVSSLFVVLGCESRNAGTVDQTETESSRLDPYAEWLRSNVILRAIGQHYTDSQGNPVFLMDSARFLTGWNHLNKSMDGLEFEIRVMANPPLGANEPVSFFKMSGDREFQVEDRARLFEQAIYAGMYFDDESWLKMTAEAYQALESSRAAPDPYLPHHAVSAVYHFQIDGVPGEFASYCEIREWPERDGDSPAFRVVVSYLHIRPGADIDVQSVTTSGWNPRVAP